MADNNFPMRMIDGGQPLIVPADYERWCFLQALQLERPAFWKELKALELRGDRQEIVKWMTRNNVIDDWFVEVVWDTVGAWTGRGALTGAPNFGPDTIDPEKNWFYYKKMAQEQFQVPWFHPTFATPAPGFDGAGNAESIEGFETRIRCEFESQLRHYVKYLKSVLGEDRSELRTHAQWCALAFSGLSYTAIASQFIPASVRTFSPDANVKMAVRRFAERIGLSLPSRRGRRT